MSKEVVLPPPGHGYKYVVVRKKVDGDTDVQNSSKKHKHHHHHHHIAPMEKIRYDTAHMKVGKNKQRVRIIIENEGDDKNENGKDKKQKHAKERNKEKEKLQENEKGKENEKDDEKEKLRNKADEKTKIKADEKLRMRAFDKETGSLGEAPDYRSPIDFPSPISYIPRGSTISDFNHLVKGDFDAEFPPHLPKPARKENSSPNGTPTRRKSPIVAYADDSDVESSSSSSGSESVSSDESDD